MQLSDVLPNQLSKVVELLIGESKYIWVTVRGDYVLNV